MFTVNLSYATDISEDQSDLQYQLVSKYQDNMCALVDQDSDIALQKECFEIVNNFFKISPRKLVLFILADHYLKGVGTTKDIPKALKMYEEIANSKSKCCAIEAEYILGGMFGAKDSAFRDLKKAKYWLRRAYLHGYTNAQDFYANVLEQEGQRKAAVYWYKKAAAQNNLTAMYELARFVRKGQKIGLSRNQAYELLYKAAAEVFPHAFYELSKMYEQDGEKKKSDYWLCRFMNTEVYKDINNGMNGEEASSKFLNEKIKREYLIKLQKEKQEREKEETTKNVDSKTD